MTEEVVRISEWLPNPRGKDAEGEWFELVNQGEVEVNLAGWSVGAGDGTRAIFQAHRIRPGEHLVFLRSETKLTLRNLDGALTLFRPDGRVVDELSFAGSAPEEKSFGRYGNVLSFGDPTPGLPNGSLLRPSFETEPRVDALAVISRGVHENNVVFLILGVGVFFAALALFLIKRDETLSELFFG
ncbi:lamin tail domain-containing protein [Candidatus Parcubacteria bacterium]|nr:MAG: lamin tail domain-containing protein [Candidatus Parcubacteria bacterium]